jgi:hypothetical protein
MSWTMFMRMLRAETRRFMVERVGSKRSERVTLWTYRHIGREHKPELRLRLGEGSGREDQGTKTSV